MSVWFLLTYTNHVCLLLVVINNPWLSIHVNTFNKYDNNNYNYYTWESAM